MKELDKLNERLAEMGMATLALVDPGDLIGARLNARYLPAEIRAQFVDNVMRDNRLESVPLVWQDPDLPKGKYRIISGHQRVDVAKEAGLKQILVMVATPKSQDEVASKILAHNAIVGRDDEEILAQLFNSIQDVALRLATGLSDEAGKVNYQSINFRVGNYKEFTVAFLPPDIEAYDEAMEAIAREMTAKSSGSLRIASIHDWDAWKKAIVKIKRIENIKSNGAAVSRLCELAVERLNQLNHEVQP